MDTPVKIICSLELLIMLELITLIPVLIGMFLAASRAAIAAQEYLKIKRKLSGEADYDRL